MRQLFTIFIFHYLIFGQNHNIYDRPFQKKPNFNIDVLHYEINLKINDLQKTFFGKTSIKFKILKSEIDTVRFDSETYKVSLVNEKNLSIPYIQTDSSLIILPSKTLYKDEIIEYTIYYQSDGKIANPANYNMGGVKVLGLGFFDESDYNPALVQTHSWPEGARHWFPSNDHPADKATSKIVTTVRSDWKVLSNGALIDVKPTDSGDSLTYTWQLDLPNSTYLYVMVAGPFEVIQDYYKDIPMSYWVYPKDKKNAHLSFHRTPEIMEFFEKEYGVPYPWPKMDQITIPGINGGAESTTATILGETTIHDEKAEKDFPSHWLVAHEAAHQWFGDYITMSNWHHAWLNESFATYGEYLYSTHLYGIDEGKINLWKKKQSYLNEYRNSYSRPMVHPYWEYPNQNFDSHIYPRGAAVLHMLRVILGDKIFKEFQTVFLNKFAFGNPDTQDLIDVVNQVSKQDLSWFFQQWVLSAGHPQIDINTKFKNKELIVEIKQTQEGIKTPEKYYIPAKISFFMKNEIVEKEIIIDERNSIHRFPMKKEPIFVRFDPDDDLLIEVTQKHSYKGLLNKLKRDNLIGRMRAAESLYQYLDNPKTIKILKQTTMNDSSWIVRKSAFQAVGSKMSSKEFISAYQSEKHSEPRKVIISEMSKFYPSESLKLIRENLDTDNSYIVQEEMIKNLGNIGDESDILRLKSYEKEWSPRRILKNATVESLSKLRDK